MSNPCEVETMRQLGEKMGAIIADTCDCFPRKRMKRQYMRGIIVILREAIRKLNKESGS